MGNESHVEGALNHEQRKRFRQRVTELKVQREAYWDNVHAGIRTKVEEMVARGEADPSVLED